MSGGALIKLYKTGSWPMDCRLHKPSSRLIWSFQLTISEKRREMRTSPIAQILNLRRIRFVPLGSGAPRCSSYHGSEG